MNNKTCIWVSSGVLVNVMIKVIKGTDLMNYSMDELKALVKPGVRLKTTRQEDYLELTGLEVVEPANGGELIKDAFGIYHIVGEHEPKGIRLLDGTLIGIMSLEEMIID